jgi:hypothetical protein
MRLLLTRGRSYEEWMKLLPHYPKMFILLISLVFTLLWLPGFIFFDDMFIIPLIGNTVESFTASLTESISIMVYYAFAFFVIHFCRNFLKRWVPLFMVLVDCMIVIFRNNKLPGAAIKYTKYQEYFIGFSGLCIFFIFPPHAMSWVTELITFWLF